MSIKLNYTYALSDVVGGEHGVSQKELEGLKEKLISARESINRKKSEGKLGFMELPYKKAEALKIQKTAAALKRKFDNFVVVGIGGSALGNIALQTALRPLYWNFLSKKERRGNLRIYVPDNVDPELIKGLEGILDFKKTVFNVISKSGTTAECLANYFFFKKTLLKKVGKKYREHLIFTTDASKGFLREAAIKENIATFEIPQNVGGRFSVLSPVGLLSGSAAGINIQKLLEGAAAAADAYSSEEVDILKNPAAVFAAINYLLYLKNKPMVVMLPYSNALYGISDWFRQLWAESLGKKLNIKGEKIFAGPTPIKAVGATDQHSQIQLYIEGPFDKIIVFLSVGKFRTSAPIPRIGYKHYLEGHTLNRLIKSEEEATRVALAKEKRPNITIEIPTINEENVGALIYMLELATAYAGELFEINAFDQPGVELGKQLTYGLMGRAGFEDKKKETEDFKSKFQARIIP